MNCISIALSLLLICVFFSPNFVTSVLSQTTTGKCVPIPKWSGEYSSGYFRPACASVLEDAGYTHYWVTPDQVPRNPTVWDESTTPPLESICLADTFYVFDAPAHRLLNSFSISQPSTVCQNLILTNVCLSNVKVCDPEVDVAEYISSERQKPCNWLCRLWHTNLDELCNLDDRVYLKAIGVDLTGDLNTVQGLNCSSDLFAPPESDDLILPSGKPACIAPAFIRPEPQSPRCELYKSDGVCSSLYGSNTMVYIPGGTRQEDMETELAASTFMLNAIPLLSSGNSCSADVFTLFCKGFFRECTNAGIKLSPRGPDGYPDLSTDPISTTLAMSLGVPLNECLRFRDNCMQTEFFQDITPYLSSVLRNCGDSDGYRPSVCFTNQRTASPSVDSSYQFNSKLFFDTYEYENFYFDGANGYVYHGTTYSATAATSVSNIPYPDTCPSPLVIADVDSPSKTVYGTESLRARCSFPCPTPVFTTEQRATIEAASWVCIIFSVAASALLSLSFTIFHSQRHKTLTFWYTLSYFGLSIVAFLGLLVRKGGSMWDTQCKNATDYSHMEGFGLFQAMFIVFFLISSTSWWLLGAVDLFQKMILGLQFRRGSKEYKKRQLAFHLFAWGNGVIICAACLVAEQFGYNSSQQLPFAYIAFDPTAYNMTFKYSMSIIVFIHIILCLAIAMVLMGIILTYLIRYDPTGGLKKFQDEMEKKQNTYLKLKYILKLFGFLFLLIPMLILLILRELVIAAKTDGWYNSQLQWGQYLILSPFGSHFFTGQVMTLNDVDHIAVGIVVMSVFAFTSPGIMMFLLYFLLSSDVYGLWFGIFYYTFGIQCCQRFAKEDTTTGSDASGSSGSHGSNSGGSSQGSAKTNQSSDLFSGNIALTNRARGNAIQEGPSATGSVVSGSGGSSTGESTGPQLLPKEQAKLAQVKKNQLFKGFTKQSNDHRSKTPRATSQSRDDGDIEMTGLNPLACGSPTSGVGLQLEPMSPSSMVSDRDGSTSPVGEVICEENREESVKN